MNFNGGSWQKIFQKNYAVENTTSKFKVEKLTPSIVLPNVLTNHIIALGVHTSYSKSSWKFAGKAYQLIKVDNIANITHFKGSKKYELNINAVTQITFDSAFNGYQIVLDLPDWFKDALIELWVYVGQAVEGTIQQTLLEIKAELQRIEDQYESMGRQ